MATYGRREGSERMMKAAASGADAVAQASAGLRAEYGKAAAAGARASEVAVRGAMDAEAADARKSIAERDTKLAEKGSKLRERELGLREKELDRRIQSDERRAELDEIKTLIDAQQAGATISDQQPPAAPGGAGPAPQEPEVQGPPMPQQGGQEPQQGQQDPMAQADSLLQKLMAGDQQRQQEQMSKPLEVTIGGRTISIPPPQPKSDLVSRAHAASGLMNAMTAFRNARDRAFEAEAKGDNEQLVREQEAMLKSMDKTRSVLNDVASQTASPKTIAELAASAEGNADPELQAFFQTKGDVGRGAAVRFLRNQLMNQNLQYVATGGNFVDADYSHPVMRDFLNLYNATSDVYRGIAELDQTFLAERPLIQQMFARYGTFEQWAGLGNDFGAKNKFLRQQTAQAMLARMTLLAGETPEKREGNTLAQGGGGQSTLPAGAVDKGPLADVFERGKRAESLEAENERLRSQGGGSTGSREFVPGAGWRSRASTK